MRDADPDRHDADPDRLDAARSDRLARILAEAVARQEEAIDRCIDDALRFMPRPLRGPVRRILGVDHR